MIGQEWKCSNAWSGLILIGRKFDQEIVKGRVFQNIAELVISFEGLEGGTRKAKISGDNYGEDPPVSMPNTVVKLPDADDSALEAARENMSLPGLKKTDT